MIREKVINKAISKCLQEQGIRKIPKKDLKTASLGKVYESGDKFWNGLDNVRADLITGGFGPKSREIMLIDATIKALENFTTKRKRITTGLKKVFGA